MRRVQTSTRGGSSLAGRLGSRPQQRGLQQERGAVNQRGGSVDRRFGGRGGGRPTNTRERKVNIRHIVKITGYNPKTEIGAFRSFLEKKADVQFLEFNPNNNQIEAYLATKAEALSLNNLSGLFYGNRKV